MEDFKVEVVPFIPKRLLWIAAIMMVLAGLYGVYDHYKTVWKYQIWFGMDQHNSRVSIPIPYLITPDTTKAVTNFAEAIANKNIVTKRWFNTVDSATKVLNSENFGDLRMSLRDLRLRVRWVRDVELDGMLDNAEYLVGTYISGDSKMSSYEVVSYAREVAKASVLRVNHSLVEAEVLNAKFMQEATGSVSAKFAVLTLPNK